MFRDKKTQFAIRKLTTGAGILLLSVGMGINLSSKKVSASETDSVQTSETVQTESQTEPAMEQVELPTSTQETGETTQVETTSTIEETTVEEAPAETVTQEKTEATETVSETGQDAPTTDNTNTENSGNVDTGTQTPAVQPETEKPGQDPAVTDSINNENKNTVNTETQTSTTQPETDKVDESEKAPAKNEVDSSSEKEESKTDSDKKDEVDAAKPEKEDQKDDIIDVDDSILSDEVKPVEIDKDSESKPNNGKDSWLQQYRPTWEQITNKEDFPGWEHIFNGNIVFDRVEHFDYFRPQWQSTTNKDLTITQTVNGVSQDININYDVVIIIRPQIVHWNLNFVIDKVQISHIKYPNGKNEFDAVNVPSAPDGFENKVTGTLIGANSGTHPDVDLSANIKDDKIQTDLTNILDILQKGEDVTFKYDIEQIAVKKPTWDDVIDGDDIEKKDWNDLFQDFDKFDKVQGTDDVWTGNVTLNKEIIQIIEGLDQENKQTINLTKDVTITIQRDGNTNTFKILKVEQSNWASNGNDSFGSTNISKPGFNHNVSATITGTDSNNFTHKVENGHLSTNLDFSKLENNENSVTIKYDVTYSPDWSGVDLPDNVHFDKKDDHTWTGTLTTDKFITQTVNGISQQIKLSQTITYTLTLKNNKWGLSDNKDNAEVKVEGNNPLTIPTKPGYNIDKVEDDNANLDFKTNDQGQIIVDEAAWQNAWNSLSDKDTIKYTVTYKPNFGDIKLPEGMTEDNLKPDKDNENIFTGSITTNKVINQTVNGKPANNITFSQTVSVTVTLENGKWVVSDPVITVTGNSPLDISKPGYIINKVEADIIGSSDFKIENGNIVITDKVLANLKNDDTINYTVTYTPNWNNVEWPEDIDKDDINNWDQDDEGNWSGTATIDKVITQTVNGKDTNSITLSQSVNVTLKWDEAKGKLIATAKPVGAITVVGNSPININKPGYKHEVTSDDNLNFKAENGKITVTDETWQNAWATLKNGDKINYTVTYSADFDDIKWPEGMDKDDFTQTDENTWTANTTINKVINQTVVNGGSNTLTWSQDISFTLTLKDGKWEISDKKADPVVTVQGDKLNISKPGYTINKVDASIDKKHFTVDSAGNIVLNDSIWDTLKNGASLDIEYKATYTPNWNNVDWPEGIDKDKIEDWTENTDGSWTGTTSINKVINQTVNGTSNQITLSQAVTVNLTLKDGIWTAVAVPGTVTVKDDNPLNITKPGYNYSKDDISASIDGTNFNGFKVDENGNIVVAADAWATLNNGDTINYTVKYTPNWNDVQWPEDVDKDEIKDWTQNDDGSWTGNTTINKVINQTVTNGGSNTLTWSQAVKVTLTLKDGKWSAVADKGAVTVKTDKDLNITKPGYNHNVTASIGNSEFKDFTIENGNIVLNDSIWDTLKKGEILDINYNVTYSPDWTHVQWPEDMGKDDFTQKDENTWTANTTINKVINQNVNGSSNTLTWSQDISFTLTLTDGKWVLSDKKTDPVVTTTGDKLNINKPGYSHNVSASIDNKYFDVDTDGNIVLADSIWATLKNGEKLDVTYNVTYIPTQPQPGTVTPPDKDDNIWSDDVTDKEKDDIIDKIEDGGLTWDKNEDGTWTATVDFNKQLSQSVTGNMINGLPTITVDVTKKVTLIAELKGDKFHITSVNSGKWTSESDLGQKLPESDNKYDISATVDGTNHDGLKEEVENTNTIPDLGSELIQSIINNHKYGSPLQLGYVINANPGLADPDKPAEPDTPNVDPDMGVTQDQPDDPAAEPGKPAEPDTPNVDPDMGVTPDQPDDPAAEPGKPAEPDTPNVDPDMGVTPDQPDDPAADPGKPAEPDTPNVDPDMGVTPDQPDDPAADPGKPAEPDTPNVDPDMGVTPDQPDDPAAEPGKPAEPDTPNVDPDMGVTPDQPDDPAADPGKPAEPDTPNVDPDMGVTPEEPSNPDTLSNPGDNNGSDDSNNPGNNPGSSDSTDNIQPKPEGSPEDGTTSPDDEDFTRPLPEDVEDDESTNGNKDSDSSKTESNKNSAAAKGSNATGKKATIVPLSQSANTSQSNSTDSQNGTVATENEATLPQTDEEKDNMTMMGIIMAGLAGALTTLGTAIKKKKN